MQEIWQGIVDFFTAGRVLIVVRSLTILIVGLIFARLFSSGIGRILLKRASKQQALVFRRMSFYVLGGIVVFTAIHNLGVKMNVLLGTAGILTVAIGFASQTSASNLISGLFLMGERPFVVGDRIRVGDQVGFVISIDLLSVKLRTLDNLLVRVPNEALIKTQFTNLTHFPIRRLDLNVGIAYKEDLAEVRTVLAKVADEHPLCLDEPKPKFFFGGFGESTLKIELWAWTLQKHWFEFKTTMHERVKKALDAAGIEIAFPHRTIYTGLASKPFPVEVRPAPSSPLPDAGDPPAEPAAAGPLP